MSRGIKKLAMDSGRRPMGQPTAKSASNHPLSPHAGVFGVVGGLREDARGAGVLEDHDGQAVAAGRRRSVLAAP